MDANTKDEIRRAVATVLVLFKVIIPNSIALLPPVIAAPPGWKYSLLASSVPSLTSK